MPENIKTLIEKINQEGILAAEKKAKEIEDKANFKADALLEKARQEADRLLKEASEKISKMQEKEKSLLVQAGRDLLLVIRQEINSMLDDLITAEVKSVLTPEKLSGILNQIILSSCAQEKGEIIISLNKKDLDLLEEGFLAKLKEEVKKKIVLRPAEDIRAGLVISYDSGKSQFDFSDKALAEYIANYLKPKLKEILQVK